MVLDFPNIDKMYAEHLDLLVDDKLRPCKSVTRDAEASVKRFAEYYKLNKKMHLDDNDVMALCNSDTINDTTNTNVRVMREFGFINVVSDGNYKLTNSFVDYVATNDTPGAFILEMMYQIKNKEDLTMYSNLILCTLREGYKCGRIISFPDSEEKFVSKVPSLEERHKYRVMVHQIYGFSGRNKTPEDDVYTPNANYRVLTELKNLNLISTSDKVNGLDTFKLTPNGIHLLQRIERNLSGKASEECSHDEVVDVLSPEWFKAKAQEIKGLDEKAQKYYDEFKDKFSPDKLKALESRDVLATIFLNPYNKDNLCRIMEYDADNRLYFGSIKNGNASKYGLYYSPKEKSWVIGTSQNPEFIDEEKAIAVGGELRDFLVAGADVLSEYDSLDSMDEFNEVYEKLVEATGGNVKRIWFLKYYHMMFPTLLPTIYSDSAQKVALETIGKKAESTLCGRMAQLEMFVKECDISNVMFNHLMWHYAVNENNSEEGSTEEDALKTCLEIVREPRKNKVNPLNFIVYGAPGTGKTYSMVEYALSIVKNITLEEFKKTNQDRKLNITKYKELVKSGQIVFTTFHQNYGYEEFIQGLRPDKDSETMAFKTVDGVFKKIADNALNDKEGKNYVIIIDEINRANISKVFGELITLIEEDKRWGELNETSVTLQSGDPFAVPNNLYIIGTMNSADKSISLIDAALRRRFDFIEQKPDSSLIDDVVLKAVFENINANLVDELESTDLLIGHSYFMNKSQDEICTILNNNIIPLLYEYFYDNRKKVANVLSDAIAKASATIEIVDDKVGRLRVREKEE